MIILWQKNHFTRKCINFKMAIITGNDINDIYPYLRTKRRFTHVTLSDSETMSNTSAGILTSNTRGLTEAPIVTLYLNVHSSIRDVIVRCAGLLWSQQDFEWRWSVPLFKCLTVLEFSFILFDLCLLITFFNFIMNYVPIGTFWIFTYHKIWILSIMFCFIRSYWIIYFLACLEVSWRVVS